MAQTLKRPDTKSVNQAFKNIENALKFAESRETILKSMGADGKKSKRAVMMGMYVSVCVAFERFILETMDEPDKKITFYFLNPMVKGDTPGQTNFWSFWKIRDAVVNDAGRFEKVDVKWDNPKSPVSPVLLSWGINKDTDLLSKDVKDKQIEKYLAGLVDFVTEKVSCYKAHWKKNKELPYWR